MKNNENKNLQEICQIQLTLQLITFFFRLRKPEKCCAEMAAKRFGLKFINISEFLDILRNRQID